MSEEKNLYQMVLEDAFQKVTESIFTDLNLDGFDWDQLIDLIIEEDSPLQNVLSIKSVRLAMLYSNAKLLYNTADNVNSVGYQVQEDESEDLNSNSDSLSQEDFADFEDVEV